MMAARLSFRWNFISDKPVHYCASSIERRERTPMMIFGTWGGGIEITLSNRGCFDTFCVGLDRFG